MPRPCGSYCNMLTGCLVGDMQRILLGWLMVAQLCPKLRPEAWDLILIPVSVKLERQVRGTYYYHKWVPRNFQRLDHPSKFSACIGTMVKRTRITGNLKYSSKIWGYLEFAASMLVEFSYLWPIAAAMGILYSEFHSSCYQKNPKAELIAAAIKNSP